MDESKGPHRNNGEQGTSHGITKESDQIQKVDGSTVSDSGNSQQSDSPGMKLAKLPGFEPEVRLKPTLQAYLVWLVTCPCGTRRVIDRRRAMDTFFETHRSHHEGWKSLTSSDFDWSISTRECSKRPPARRINEDLGPIWKKARAGEWNLLASPSNWHSVARQAVANMQTWKNKQAGVSITPRNSSYQQKAVTGASPAEEHKEATTELSSANLLPAQGNKKPSSDLQDPDYRH